MGARVVRGYDWDWGNQDGNSFVHENSVFLIMFIQEEKEKLGK